MTEVKKDKCNDLIQRGEFINSNFSSQKFVITSSDSKPIYTIEGRDNSKLEAFCLLKLIVKKIDEILPVTSSTSATLTSPPMPATSTSATLSPALPTSATLPDNIKYLYVFRHEYKYIGQSTISGIITIRLSYSNKDYNYIILNQDVDIKESDVILNTAVTRFGSSSTGSDSRSTTGAATGSSAASSVVNPSFSTLNRNIITNGQYKDHLIDKEIKASGDLTLVKLPIYEIDIGQIDRREIDITLVRPYPSILKPVIRTIVINNTPENNFFEGQQRGGCGRHALNNLLGDTVFTYKSDNIFFDRRQTESLTVNNIEDLDNQISLMNICRLYISENPGKHAVCDDQENYDIHILQMALGILGISISRGTFQEVGKRDTKLFEEENKEANCIGYLVHTPNHWTAVRKLNNGMYRYINTAPKTIKDLTFEQFVTTFNNKTTQVFEFIKGPYIVNFIKSITNVICPFNNLDIILYEGTQFQIFSRYSEGLQCIKLYVNKFESNNIVEINKSELNREDLGLEPEPKEYPNITRFKEGVAAAASDAQKYLKYKLKYLKLKESLRL